MTAIELPVIVRGSVSPRPVILRELLPLWRYRSGFDHRCGGYGSPDDHQRFEEA